MAFPVSPYIDEYEGALRISGTRVSLDSVIIRFQEGASPEKIVCSFPTLKLSQVYGAIAYYLDNQDLLNEYLSEGQCGTDFSAAALSQTDPELFARLQAARRELGSNRK